MKKAASTVTSIPRISREDQDAIYRLTEQAETLLAKAKAIPKAKMLVQKAQEICDDIRRILHNSNELTVCDLFEVAIAPRLVRLAQELKLQRNLKVRYKPATSYLPAAITSTSPTKRKGDLPNNGDVVKNILTDLRDMLK